MRRFLWASLVCAVIPVSAQTKNGEWRTYGGDLGNTRYSALDQINALNFDKLQLAWKFSTLNLGPRPEFNLEATPLMVGGVVYTLAGGRGDVVAVAATDGELRRLHTDK